MVMKRQRQTYLGLLAAFTLNLGFMLALPAAQEGPDEVYSIIGSIGGIALQPDGKIVIANPMAIYTVNTKSGTIALTRTGAARFHRDGSIDRSFQCTIDPYWCNAMATRVAIGPDGRMLLTGVFHSVDGKLREGVAMLLPDGRLDESFQPWRGLTNELGRGSSMGAAGHIAALLNDGSVAMVRTAMDDATPHVVCRLDATGRYVYPTETNATPRRMPMGFRFLYTLQPEGFWAQRPVDWTRDTVTDWPQFAGWKGAPPAFFPPGRQLPTAADAGLLLRNTFNEVPIELCRYAARLPDGGVVLAVKEANGSRLMRFDNNWRPDLSFTNHFVTGVHSHMSLVLQPDGKLLVAGLITELNGEPFPGLVRLDQSGAIDRGFHCQTAEKTPIDFGGRVMAVALQDDGRILIGGFFSQVNGADCRHFARLESDGSLDKSFQSRFSSFEGLNAWRRLPVQIVSASTIATNTSAAYAGTNSAPAATGSPTPQTVMIISLSVKDDRAIVQIQGNPNQSYILQATEMISSGSWVSLETNLTDETGGALFEDHEAGRHPARFYRIATPQ